MEDRAIAIHTIRRGDVFWECEGGRDALFIATTDATREGNGIGLFGREIPGGEVQHFFEHDRGRGYGPRLYTMPQYTSRPTWAALLPALAAIMRDEQQRAAAIVKARENALSAEILDYRTERNSLQADVDGLRKEIARLRSLIQNVAATAARPANGIEMGNRILHMIDSAEEASTT